MRFIGHLKEVLPFYSLIKENMKFLKYFYYFLFRQFNKNLRNIRISKIFTKFSKLQQNVKADFDDDYEFNGFFHFYIKE